MKKLNITKRDFKFFLLRFLTMFIFALWGNWADFKKGFNIGFTTGNNDIPTKVVEKQF